MDRVETLEAELALAKAEADLVAAKAAGLARSEWPSVRGLREAYRNELRAAAEVGAAPAAVTAKVSK